MFPASPEHPPSGRLGTVPLLQGTVAAILVLAVVSFLPDFRGTVVPCSDARQYHSAFHVFFAGIRYENEIPRWLPYGRFGTDAIVLMMYVTPAGYLSGLLGKLLSCSNSLPLFKVMVFIEFLVFCAGSLRLSLLLFRHLASVAFVNIGAVLSFSWLMSLDSNFHTYYLLPFILDQLVRYFRNGRAGNLVMAALFGVVSAIGNIPYYPPLTGLLLVLFSLVQFGSRKFRLPRQTFAASDALAAAALLLLGAAYVGSYVLNFQNMAGYSEGRDPVTRKAEIESFLQYGGVTKPGPLLVAFLTGMHTHGDNTFYVGLATLVLAGIAMVKCRGGDFTAVACGWAFLLLFSCGGLLAAATYHVPGMAYYRHVGLVFGQVKYLLLLLAGFGLDDLLRHRPEGPATAAESLPLARGGAVGWRLVGAALLIVELTISGLSSAPEWETVLWPRGLRLTEEAWGITLLRCGSYLFILGAVYGIARRRMPHRMRQALTGALLSAFLVDMGSFKLMQFRNWQELDTKTAHIGRRAFEVSPPVYQSVRVPAHEAEKRHPTLHFLATDGPIYSRYAHLYSVAGVDPRMPIYRTDFLSSGVDALLRARQVRFRMSPTEQILPWEDAWLSRALGSGAPKIRLFRESQVDYCPPGTSFERVKALPLTSDTLVLEGPRNAVPASAEPPPRLPPEEPAVREFGFNRVVVETTVAEAGPAWLYYSDAAHEGWTATLNGEPAPIARANVGFKAVRLRPGTNRVELRFWNAWGSCCMYLLFAGSIVFFLGLGIRGAGLLRGLRAEGAR